MRVSDEVVSGGPDDVRRHQTFLRVSERRECRNPLLLLKRSSQTKYDWSNRAKTREVMRHVRKALEYTDEEYKNSRLTDLLSSLEWFVAEREVAGVRVTVSKTEAFLLYGEEVEQV
ncbi:unnamed protein product [Soboliphyme baturini]|uniref:IMS_C domain-containing protein n=1 Tax=Soboliphyme baturini TaxID=241478 RepID=A0A183J4X4_9BILA|nr:unnamed protein product [Soboliphyme baturini]